MEKGNGIIEVLVDMMPSINQENGKTLFLSNKITFNSWKNKTSALVEISENDIQTLANYPWVKFIQTTSAPTVVENLKERTNHRVNTIDASYATGLHYDGTGVSVAVGDDGTVGPHIDFAGRLFPHTTSNFGTHADHVVGIVGGGGNFDPITSGHARGSDLHIYSDYDNLFDAPTRLYHRWRSYYNQFFRARLWLWDMIQMLKMLMY